jgi:hypothetical protein
MKIISLNKWVLGGMAALALSAQAQTFQYNNGDVLIGFRNEASGTSDLVINAGPVSAFTNLLATPGSTINITALAGAKLAAAFGQTNGLAWSASACFNVLAPAGQDTIFMSRQRSDYNNQSSPWVAKGDSEQDNTVAKIDLMGTGAVAIGGGIGANSVTNTTTSLIEPEGFGVAPKFSYLNVVKTKPLSQDPNSGRIYANWLGTFQGNPEQLTDTLPARADFYWMPANGTTTYLGYFELSADGSLVFHSGPSPFQSQITNIVRNGNNTTVYFTTGTTGTYTLLTSDDITLPLSSWTTVSSVSGDGSVKNLSDTTASAARFYAISAQ